MGLISGGQKTVTSATSVDSSQKTSDNKVAAQNSNVLASGGGALTNQAGATIVSGGTLNQVDPGSYAFASHVVDAALKVGSDTVNGVGSTLSQVGAAIAGAGPSSSVPDAPKAGGFNWKLVLWPAVALVGVVGLVVMLKRRRA